MSYLKYLLLLAAVAVVILGGCNRYVDDERDANQPPQVRFINVPQDGDTFAYAPIVHWTGHDPDGQLAGFEYYDDSSPEGLAAYRAGDAQWQAYLNALPQSVWTFTESANQQIFLLSELNEVTEHLFLVRSVDNLNAHSGIAWRTFFRTNLAPNAPKLRWAGSTATDYFSEVTIEDTLLVGDTLTITYAGVQLLWQGSDPDSRIGNVIQLQFSYLLVKLPDDTVALPVRDDSNRVVGYRAGWSDWGVDAQISLSALETGDYTFFLNCRDDGFEEVQPDSFGRAHFTVVKPTFDRRIMIVDENKPLAGVESQRGGVDPDTLLAFYRGTDGQSGVIGEALGLANQLVPFLNAQWPETPIAEFTQDDIFWYENRTSQPIPYELIRQFDLVWIIDDDNTAARPVTEVPGYTKVLGDYLDVGGKLWMSGRRLFNKSMSIPPSNAPNDFLRDYFNLFSVRSKNLYNNGTDPNSIALSGLADFRGAVAGDPQFPDLEIDSAMIGRLRYTNRTVQFPPEIETFGRSNVQQSFDFSTTIYNYNSSTSDTNLFPPVVTDFDCPVDTNYSDTLHVALIPREEGFALLRATSIRNITRGVEANYITVRNVSTNLLRPQWRIIASIPLWAGEWTTSDSLAVTYNYIPLSSEHDEPCATNFVKYTGTIEIEVTENGFITRVTAEPVFRSSLFTFPLPYMKNQPFNHPILGSVNSVSMLIANQLLYFNQNLDVSFGQD